MADCVERYADLSYDPPCQTCGGDGIAECDGDCPESDDNGCPYAEPHFVKCPNCRGSGRARDQWYW